MLRTEIDNLEIYRDSMKLADQIWHLVIEWSRFSKDTLGTQIIKASDSIAASISEGYGRFFFKENRQYCYIARGSLYETKTFIIKARNRNLLSLNDYSRLCEIVESLITKLNGYIRYIELQIKNL